MHHEMRQGIIVLGLYPCFTSGKDNEKLNTYQIFPDFFIKTSQPRPVPSVTFWEVHGIGTQKRPAATPFLTKEVAAAILKPCNGAQCEIIAILARSARF